MRLLSLMLLCSVAFAVSQEEQDKAWAEAMRESAKAPARKAEVAERQAAPGGEAQAEAAGQESDRNREGPAGKFTQAKDANAKYRAIVLQFAASVAKAGEPIKRVPDGPPRTNTDTPAQREAIDRKQTEARKINAAVQALEELVGSIERKEPTKTIYSRASSALIAMWDLQ